MHELIFVLGLCAAGCSLGIVTGLTPGIHVNTLLPFILLAPLSGIMGAVLIFSLAITHTFVDFIPSTIFGVPDGDTALTVLPAHRLLLGGRGYEAIKLTILGSLGAFMVSCILAAPMVYCIPAVYHVITPYIGYILVFFVGFMILSEKSIKSILCALFIFLLSGSYGYSVLSATLICDDLVLFPVFSGLFGLSIILISLKNKSELPLQSIDSRIHLTPHEIILNILKGTLAGMAVSLVPGIGPAHATAVISVQSSPRQFLVAVSGVNTANAVYALVGLYTIGKARSGAVVAIRNLVHVNGLRVIILISCGLVAAGIASVAALLIARCFLLLLSQINYSRVMGSTCAVLILTVWIVTGLSGLLVMGVGCCIGILPIFMRVRRSHCMGALLFPVMIYYLTPSL